MPELTPQFLTVSELTSCVRAHLERQFSPLWVQGEISNLRCPSSGHVYLTLKDQKSQIRAVLFRSHASRLTFTLQDGLEVFVFGKLTVYEPRGEYQLLLEAVEPRGLGLWGVAYQQLKAKLEAEGLFEESRKRPLPPFPSRIGLVTSPFGAALHDLITVIQRRWPLAHVIIVPVSVQGREAGEQVVSAIRLLNEWSKIDVLIVGRGGGAIEDLWTFNEESVIRAIAQSAIPVVSAVGHQTDLTLADLAADFRAPTPSAAAELVTPEKESVLEQCAHLQIRLRRSMESRVVTGKARVLFLNQHLPEPRLILAQFVQRVEEVERHLAERFKEGIRYLRERVVSLQAAISESQPLFEIRRFQGRLTEVDRRLGQGIRGILQGRRLHVRGLVSQLHQLSPLAVLERGYGIVQVEGSQKVVTESSTVQVGERVRARLHRGELLCTVRAIIPPAEGKAFDS